MLHLGGCMPVDGGAAWFFFPVNQFEQVFWARVPPSCYYTEKEMEHAVEGGVSGSCIMCLAHLWAISGDLSWLLPWLALVVG